MRADGRVLSRRLTAALGMPAYWAFEEGYGLSLFVEGRQGLRRLCCYGYEVRDEDDADDLAMRDLEILRYLLNVMPR